jgi:hypothetical protein
VGFGDEAEPGRLGRDLVGCDPVEPHDVLDRLAAADFAAPVDRRATVIVHDREQLAGVAHAGDLARVRGRGHVVLLVEAVHRVGHRRGQQPAGLEVIARAA